MLYKHFKGGTYTVLHEAVHTETNETMIVYISHKHLGSIWVRPKAMFFEVVEWPDGTKAPRFVPACG